VGVWEALPRAIFRLQSVLHFNGPVESVGELVARSGGKATMETVAAKRYEQTTWDLSELLPEPSEEIISERLAGLETAVEAFEKRRENLDSELDKGTFLEILGEYEALLERFWVLGAFGSLWFAADTQSEAALTYKNRIEQILTGHENRILFFTLWWKGLGDEEAARILPSVDEHADYRHFLADLRRLKPFTLEERSEQIVNLKDANGMGAVLTLYAMLTNRLEFELEVDGETRTLTRDELMSHAFSPEPERREATYKELYRVFEHEAKVLAQMYVNRVRDWYSENVELRGFSSPIAVRNIANDIPDAAVETLLDVTSENVGLFQRYFRVSGATTSTHPWRPRSGRSPTATPSLWCSRPWEPFTRWWRRRPSGSLPTTTSTASSGRARRGAPFVPPCCRAKPPGCCSTTPAVCATWPRWPTSWVTRCTACWPRTIRS
jgi:hypothetical protein